MLENTPHTHAGTQDYPPTMPIAIGHDFRLEQSRGSLEEIEELRRRYSALLIHLDRLRPIIASADVLYRPEGDEWSIKEILGHLIDTDKEIWWPRIQAILESNRSSTGGQSPPSFEDVNELELVRRHHWQSIPIEDVVCQLMRIRWDFAMRLAQLPASAYQYEGEHSVHGTLSVLNIVQILVAHDAHYLEKIHEIVNVTGTTLPH